MSTPFGARFVLLLVTGLGICPPAAAQLVPGPTGSVRGVFGGGGGTGAPQFDLNVQFTGGYDDNILPIGLVVPPDQQDQVPIQSGYAATLNAQGSYRRGTGARYLRTQFGGTVNQFELGVVGPAAQSRTARVVQGTAAAQAAFDLGRRFGMRLDASTLYEPANVFPTLAVLDQAGVTPPEVEAPPAANLAPGIVNQRWLTTQMLAGLNYRWTPRQRTDVEFFGLFRDALSDSGYDARTLNATVRHSWTLSRSAAVDVAYRNGRFRQLAPEDRTFPFNSQGGEARVSVTRRLSPSRTITLVGGGGLVRTEGISIIDSLPFDFVAPVVTAGLRVELSSRWLGVVDGRRDAAVLGGLTQEVFATYAVSGSLTGRIGRRLGLLATSAYTTGNVPTGVGAFDALTAGVQLQLGLGRTWGLTAGYTYYDHQLAVLSALQTFPATYTRNSFRVGFSTWLPLYGVF